MEGVAVGCGGLDGEQVVHGRVEESWNEGNNVKKWLYFDLMWRAIEIRFRETITFNRGSSLPM
jgi:hypothetical protein